MLHRLETLSRQITLAIAGIGSIGKGLVFQSHITPGIETIAIADVRVERATACAEWLARDYRVVASAGALNDAVRQGKLAVCEDGELLAQCQDAVAYIEATNSVAGGGQHAIAALQNGKHVLMMNYEADLLFGPYLLSLARDHGVVYSGADGDQPAVIKRLVDDLLFWGFELVMAGNIKGYLDRYANPTSIIPEADKRCLDYRMCTSYTDGTKLCVEMAVVANALGLRAAVPGMVGPRGQHVHDVFHLFDLDALWRNREPVVDYVLGAQPTGGVFAIGHTDNEFQQYTLDWFPPKMGPGPYYLFYRPYHLGHIEAMACVVEAVLDGRALLQPRCGLRTNVYAYAKRDLHAGETLDGIGGYTCYGLIENCLDNVQHPGLPICLAEGVVLQRDVAKDGKVYLDDVRYDRARFDFETHARALSLSREGGCSHNRL